MNPIIFILCCISAGMILRKVDILGKYGPSYLNKLIIYFFIPLLSLLHVSAINLKLSLIWLTVTPFLVFGLSVLSFHLFAAVMNLGQESKAVLILTGGISSTSFVGFPIFEMCYGEEGLAYGIMLSMGGTILVFNTLGIGTLFYFAQEKNSIWGLLKKIIYFLPFIAFVCALLLNLLDVQLPSIILTSLKTLTSPFSIIALLTIGMNIEIRDISQYKKELSIGLIFKLLIAPLGIYLLMWHLLDIQSLIAKICIMGAAIGSMNAMSIMTAEKGLKPQLAMLMPAISIPLSIPLLLLIHKILG